MRSQAFPYAAPAEVPVSLRHRARQINFDDQSIYAYSNPGSHWWGYA